MDEVKGIAVHSMYWKNIPDQIRTRKEDRVRIVTSMNADSSANKES